MYRYISTVGNPKNKKALHLENLFLYQHEGTGNKTTSRLANNSRTESLVSSLSQGQQVHKNWGRGGAALHLFPQRYLRLLLTEVFAERGHLFDSFTSIMFDRELFIPRAQEKVVTRYRTLS